MLQLEALGLFTIYRQGIYIPEKAGTNERHSRNPFHGGKYLS